LESATASKGISTAEELYLYFFQSKTPYRRYACKNQFASWPGLFSITASELQVQWKSEILIELFEIQKNSEMNIKGELDPGKLDLELFPLFSYTCRFFIVHKK
jgi:hypothetical protein